MFESREPKNQMPPMPRVGPERRRGVERRRHDERREMIRFEPGKAHRRSGKDRRSNAWAKDNSR